MGNNIIVAENHEAKLAEFNDLMLKTNLYLNNKAKNDPKTYHELNGIKLEDVVLDTMKELAVNTSFNPNSIIKKSGQYFPDIIANKYYGVEVKTTKENKWKSTGSSILEGTRIKDVERIYMLFGKLTNPVEFKCRPYEECLYEIAVTHSPRYLIDMELDEKDTIFSKMDIGYDDFRLCESPIEKVRQYYKNKIKKENNEGKQMPWWFGTDRDGQELSTTNINLILWGCLGAQEKAYYKAFALILFPEVIDSDYKRMALWLCTHHSILCNNTRDLFSAGGTFSRVDGKSLVIPYPHLVGEYVNNIKLIKRIIEEESIYEEIKEFWEDLQYRSSIFDQWLDRTERAFSSNDRFEMIPIRRLIESESELTLK